MFVAFDHAFSRAVHFLYCTCIALILKVSSPFEGIWSSKKSNESGMQERPSRSLLRSSRETTTTVLKRERCLSNQFIAIIPVFLGFQELR